MSMSLRASLKPVLRTIRPRTIRIDAAYSVLHYRQSLHHFYQQHDVRSFTTTSLPRAAHVSSHGLTEAEKSTVLAAPSQAYLEQEEIDVTLPDEKDVDISLTERAAEQLRSMADRNNDSKAALRVLVDSGGCHGYQYKYEVAKEYHKDDYHFSHPTVKPSNLYIDAISLALINGSTVDYSTELIGSSFKVIDNPKSKGSGCGCGTSWELKA